MNWQPDTYIKAYRFAAYAHHGQCIPGTEISYLMHLSMVSMEVMAALAHSPERDGDLAIQCALLHDVLEDTNTPYQAVQEQFGKAVADGVAALSKNATLPKSDRMQDSLQRIQQQPKEIWMVKLADRITNLQPPPPHWDETKIAAYKAEAKVILQTLGTADRFLAERLKDKIEQYGRKFTVDSTNLIRI